MIEFEPGLGLKVPDVSLYDLIIRDNLRNRESFEYGSKNFLQASAELPLNDQGLIEGVALAGSTNVLWRPKVIDELSALGIVTFNPDVGLGNWEDSFAVAEKSALQNMSVVGFYIENDKNIVDGSLGSLVEIDKIVLSAILRGQRMIVCIAEGFEETLQDPGALAQYQILIAQLQKLSEKHPGFLTVRTSSSRNEYLQLGIQMYHAQTKRVENSGRVHGPLEPLLPVSVEALQDFDAKRIDRLKKKQVNILVTGSSDAQFKGWKKPFRRIENDLVKQMRRIPGSRITLVNRGDLRKPWDLAYSVDDLFSDSGVNPVLLQEMKMRLYKRAFQIEQAVIGDKADIILIKIQRHSISKGAVSNVGFQIEQAFDKGQQVILYMENLDPNTFITQWILELKSKIDRALNGPVPPTEEDLSVLADAKIIDKSLRSSSIPLFKRIRASAFFNEIGLFPLVDNANRTRSIFDQQMAGLIEQRKNIQQRSGVVLFETATSMEEVAQITDRLIQARTESLSPNRSSLVERSRAEVV